MHLKFREKVLHLCACSLSDQMTSRHLLYTLAFVWHVINESLWGQNQSQQSIIMYTYFHFFFFYSLACCKVSAKQRRCHLLWISTGLEGSSWLLPKSIRKDMGGISLWFCWFQKSIMTEQMFNKKKKTCPILYFALKNVLHNLSLVPILLFFPCLDQQQEICLHGLHETARSKDKVSFIVRM